MNSRNLFICVCGVMLISCEKNIQEKLYTNADKVTVQVTLNNNVLTCKSFNEFQKLKKQLSELSDEDYESWLNQIGYTSMEREYKTVLNELENVKCYEEYLRILNDNKDIIEIKDNTICPTILDPLTRKIINRGGYICYGNTMIKYDSLYVYKFRKNEKKGDVETENMEIETKYQWLFSAFPPMPDDERWCLYYNKAEIKNQDGDRKAELKLYVTNEQYDLSTPAPYEPQIHLLTAVHIWGRALKKNFWGNFVEYKTNNYLNYDFAVVKNNINATPIFYSGSISNQDRVYIGFDKEIFDGIIDKSQYSVNIIGFYYIHANDYTHRGMDGKKAILNTCH